MTVAIILAGSRGPADPVAQAAGVSHKAFALVAGRPMLERVAEVLLDLPWLAQVAVVIERPELVTAHPPFAAALAAGRLVVLPAAPSPSRSVATALEALGPAAYPALVTTADHPLLTAQMATHFWQSVAADADVAVGLARAEVILAAYPQTQRTWLRFRGGRYSGCNLFALKTPAAAGAVAFWRQVEAERKKPWRMIRLLGPVVLLRFLLGRLSLAQALARMGHLTGARLAAVDMPFAEASIDVDKASDLTLAEAILAQRGAGL